MKQVFKLQQGKNFHFRPKALIGNNYKYRGFLGGKFEGVVLAPLHIVWNTTQDFYDLTWWTDGFTVTREENDTRVVSQLYTIAAEKLLEQHQSPELCYHVYDVEMRRTNDPSMMGFFNQVNSITNTIQFRKIDEERTLYQMFSYYDGPQNLTKYHRLYFDSIYASGYPNLRDKYSILDMDLGAVLNQANARSEEQANIAMNYPDLYQPEPGLLDKVAEMIYESVHPTKQAVNLVSYPDVFTTLTAKKAEVVPSSMDILKPKKLIKLLAGFVEPTFDAYANMVASDSSFHTAAVSADPWMNYDFFIEELGSTPYRVNEEIVHKFKNHPDAVFLDYFFNGGNTLHIQRPKYLGHIPYWQDFIKDPVVGPKISLALGSSDLKQDTLLNGKLLFADYSNMELYEYPKAHKGMYVHGSVVLVLDKCGSPSGKREALGIRFNVPQVINAKGEWDYFQEGGKGINHRIYTPQSPKGLWQLAKMHASCADVNQYQFVYHLGNGHLATEILATGLHNHFRAGNKENHLLGSLLFPPIEGLIGINHFAGMSLIDPQTALTEQTFGPGTIQCVDMFAQYLNQDYKFENLGADVELANRGWLNMNQDFKSPAAFDILSEIQKVREGKESDLVRKVTLEQWLKETNAPPEVVAKHEKLGNLGKEVLLDKEGYQYRLDALWLFQLTYNHITSILDQIYPDDNAVKKDLDLQNYESFLRANVPRFDTKFETKMDVARFAATLWWVCTGYHAPSFSVCDYETYPPMRPTLLNRPMPVYDNKTELKPIDLDLALTYPKKNLVIKIMIGGVTNRTTTVNLGQNEIIEHQENMLYFKQSGAYIQEEQLHITGDIIDHYLYENKQTARNEVNDQFTLYLDELGKCIYLQTMISNLEHQLGVQVEKVKDVRELEEGGSVEDQIAQLKAMLEAQIQTVLDTITKIENKFKKDMADRAEKIPNQELKERYKQKSAEINKRISEVLRGNFIHFGEMMSYEQKFALFFAQMQDLSQNVVTRNEYFVADDELKFIYMDPKLVPSSLAS